MEQWDDLEVEMENVISGEIQKWKWELEIWQQKWEMRSVGRYGSENEKWDQWGDMEQEQDAGSWEIWK